MTVDLGAAFTKRQAATASMGVPPEVIAAIRADVIADLRSDLRKPPIVNIAPARVQVAAPNVSVTPSISVQAAEAPFVSVEVPGLMEFAAGLSQIHDDLQELITLLHQPVTKTVDRSGSGVIESIRETR